MFIDESKEHLQMMNDQLLNLEKNPEDVSIVNEVFRAAHTLKGMAGTMGFDDLASLTHRMENVLDQIRNEQLHTTSDLVDVIFDAVDDLEAIVNDVADGGDGKRDVSNVVNQLEQIENGTWSEEEHAATAEEMKNTSGGETPFFDDFERTVLNQSKEQGYNAFHFQVSLREDCILKAARVFMVFEVLEKCGEVIKSTPTVDQLEEEQFEQTFSVTLVTKEEAEEVQQKIMKVSEVEEVLVSVVDVGMLEQTDQSDQSNEDTSDQSVEQQEESKSIQPAQEVQEKQSATPRTQQAESNDKQQQQTNKTIRVNIDRLDSLMNLFEELVIDRGRLEQIASDLKSNELTETVEHMSRISGDLQNIILNMRMVPVEQVFNRFPRMVRGLTKELNKKVNLEIIGAETELDRTVIDEIGDPLVHLLRNSLDHGIETPDERTKAGKPEEGHVTLKAYHSGNHVFIEVSDDGKGINREKVLQKALDNGVVSHDNASSLSDKQVYELLFSSGLSTADQVSDISGRGVGMDVVKNKIESLGGNISVDSVPEEGSTFSIQLPLTLSIISVMLVDVQEEVYAIPLSSIIETAIVKKEDIMSAHNQDVIDFRGHVVPLVHLTDFFDVPRTREQDDYYSIVIVRKGEKMAGLVVDSFIGQQEIVLKSLGNYLQNVFAISGATILGNGQVALIIDCNAMIK
nr:chemotaxis protein CheA [Texcoconibacillus texcoconensis]